MLSTHGMEWKLLEPTLSIAKTSELYLLVKLPSSRFFLRRVSHFKGRLIRLILPKIMKIYSDFLVRLTFRSSYTCRNTVVENPRSIQFYPCNYYMFLEC